MGITTTWQGQTSNWADPSNWTAGPPLPGDTAVIGTAGAVSPVYSGFNTSMEDLTVDLEGGGYLGAFDINLVGTTIQTDLSAGPASQYGNPPGSFFVATQDIVVDSHSKISAGGNEQVSSSLSVETPSLTNNGLLQGTDNGELFLESNTGGTMTLKNNGHIAATDDGRVTITSASVRGNGLFNILNGGDLDLSQVTFAGGTWIGFSASAAQGGGTLELYDQPVLTPAVHNFEVGDLVKIDNFAATKIIAAYNLFTHDTDVDVIGAGESHPVQAFSLAGDVSASQLGFANVLGAAYVFRTS